jgi:hypothetical protein
MFLGLLMILSVSACIFTDQDLMENNAPVEGAVQEKSFQEYLWEEHTTDLFIQIGLMLAGALGVACLLPSEHEE